MVAFKPDEPPARYPTAAAIERLDAVFGFSPDTYSQDWHLELADGARLAEFVSTYANLAMDDDERFTLMTLIVASAHDALDFHDMGEAQWRPIHDLLVTDFSLHASTIYYWCCVDATCMDECFTLSSLMRSVWNDALADDARMPMLPNGG
ncbi:hypothetical protein LOC71_05040 [Rhodopirellula sp. JC740]|uniref:Uncharacterized protein n=1 Tax=Rhodopirellula halodulae TaxID=2894198 RepID=A0ABS8NDK0_9BACT|nr:hypothetical protein [Rhodopirellula sp. JC740]MCC9641630.1 hypothetical protein [Rhodopirellula sp. JC740]